MYRALRPYQAGEQRRAVGKVNLYCIHVCQSDRLITVSLYREVGGAVDRKSPLASAGTILSWARAPPPALWSYRGPRSLRSPVLDKLYNETKPNYCSFVSA
ncbi:hypothetical protein PoB_007637300 [Plakobranchus ocellatus]|uniref:Uncharacterized protein n=1 Tax=Plakobranchus ocellatus TaxID=259542 RepID=A0AAV4E0H6_9GAST|nr:hypothetical protein PoB_007637300 [Plakobranchus ocellatus]